MRRYSHLSDDEREQIGLAKAVGHSIDCQSDRPAEVDGLARTLAQQAAERALLAAPRAVGVLARHLSSSDKCE